MLSSPTATDPVTLNLRRFLPSQHSQAFIWTVSVLTLGSLDLKLPTT